MKSGYSKKREFRRRKARRKVIRILEGLARVEDKIGTKMFCAAAVAAVVFLIAAITATAMIWNGKSDGEQQGQDDTEQNTVEKSTEEMTSSAAGTEITGFVDWELKKYGCVLYGTYDAPYSEMSQDWDAEDIEGFYYHEPTEECRTYGGEAPVIIQVYTYILCKHYGVDYEMVYALIEKESGWKYNCIGDDGASTGLMQIQEKWHRERMQRLNCTDLLNPFQNVHVGIDFLSELNGYYSDIPEDIRPFYVLAAYNMGMTGAKKNLFDKGQYKYAYSAKIMERAQELKDETAAARKEE